MKVSSNTAVRPMTDATFYKDKKKPKLHAGMKACIIPAAVAASLAMKVAGAAGSVFTPGDLVVYQVGDGTTALSNTSAAVVLDDYSTTGTLNYSLELPTVTTGPNNPLSASGTATSEGGITDSANGQYLVVPGYDAAVGTVSIATTATSAVPREVGLIDANGNINDSTTTTAFSGNNIRSATSDNGTNIWMAGATTGVVTNTVGGSGAGTVVSSTVTNLRDLQIYGGQLYIGTGSGSLVRIGTVGTGEPTTSGQTITNLPGLPIATNLTNGEVSGPYEYAFATLGSSGGSPNTLYIADNGNENGSGSTLTTGNIDKFSLENGTWTATGAISETGILGLVAEATAGGEQLFFTTPTNIYSLTDSSGYEGTLSGSPTSIATAGTNEAFRGIVFAPVGVPEPMAASLIALSSGVLLIRRRKQ